MLYKTLTTRKVLISREQCRVSSDALTTGIHLQKKVKELFNGSLAIRVVTAGSSNACEQELVALSNAYYDIERFGIHFVASPRHADMLIVTGPVTSNMKEALVRTFEAMPAPHIVVALGDDAIDGGIFKGSYAVCDGASSTVPIHYAIPGDPPSPLTIIQALLSILEDISPERSHS